MTVRSMYGLPAAAALLLGACRHDVVDTCAPRSGPPPPVPNVITPASLTLFPGQRDTFVAVLYRGDPRCTKGPVTVTWSSSNASLARVEAVAGDTATVLAVAPGVAIVVATEHPDTTVRAAALVTVLTPEAAGASARAFPPGRAAEGPRR